MKKFSNAICSNMSLNMQYCSTDNVVANDTKHLLSSNIYNKTINLISKQVTTQSESNKPCGTESVVQNESFCSKTSDLPKLWTSNLKDQYFGNKQSFVIINKTGITNVKSNNANYNRKDRMSEKSKETSDHQDINLKKFTSDKLPINTNTKSTCSSSNEKYMKPQKNWKLIKQTEKEQKKLLREEEIRRQRIAPKSQNFKIIDSSYKDLVTKSVLNLKEKQNEKGHDIEFNLEESLSEFPSLGISKSSKPNKYSKQNNVNENRYVCTQDNENAKIDNTVRDCKSVIKESAENDSNMVDEHNTNSESKTKRKVRRNDPIDFNLFNALKLIKDRKNNQDKCGRISIIKKNLNKRRLISCGNELDADKPIRKRGKFREMKKKKVKKLKKIILKEREIRSILKKEAKLCIQQNNKILLNEKLDKNDFIYHAFKQNLNSTNSVINNNWNQDDNNVECNVDPKVLIHCRKFRNYCDQWPLKEMANSIHNLIKSLVRFQERTYINDPIKAQAKRRYVCGFNEVLKYMRLNKAKLVVITTDIECVEGKGGLNYYINEIKSLGETQSIPYVFSSSKWSLRNYFKLKSCVSCAAIIYYNGAEDSYKTIIELLPTVKRLYAEKLKEAEMKCGIKQQIKEDVTSVFIRSMLNSLRIDDDDDHHHNSAELEKANVIDSNNNPFMNAILKKC